MWSGTVVCRSKRPWSTSTPVSVAVKDLETDCRMCVVDGVMPST